MQLFKTIKPLKYISKAFEAVYMTSHDHEYALQILECFGTQFFTTVSGPKLREAPESSPTLQTANIESQSSTLIAGDSISGSFLGKAVPLHTFHMHKQVLHSNRNLVLLNIC